MRMGKLLGVILCVCECFLFELNDEDGEAIGCDIVCCEVFSVCVCECTMSASRCRAWALSAFSNANDTPRFSNPCSADTPLYTHT